MDILTKLLGIVCPCLIPAVIGYCWQMSLLKSDRESAGKIKLRWVILAALVVLVLSVAGMHLFLSLEAVFATTYLCSFIVELFTLAFAFGKWAARRDFRRKHKA